jgi:hypothetical protein
MASVFVASGMMRPGSASVLNHAPDSVLAQTDLPKPGVFPPVPAGSKLLYYLAYPGSVCDDAADAGKLSGLYLSSDGGQTWRNVRADLRMYEVFVHPDTGWLYALITIERFQTDFETDHLLIGQRSKILRSANGRDWIDISGADESFTEAFGIFADPDHPGRVCFRNAVMRPYVLQSMDGAYAKWRWYHTSQWRERHSSGTATPRKRQPN